MLRGSSSLLSNDHETWSEVVVGRVILSRAWHSVVFERIRLYLSSEHGLSGSILQQDRVVAAWTRICSYLQETTRTTLLSVLGEAVAIV